MDITQLGWKQQLIAGVRQLVVATVTAGLILGVLLVGFSGQTAAQQKVQEDTLHANLAQACVLALPVTETGRDPADVQECFTQYGLQAPLLHTP
jgi:hypothetical protein